MFVSTFDHEKIYRLFNFVRFCGKWKISVRILFPRPVGNNRSDRITTSCIIIWWHEYRVVLFERICSYRWFFDFIILKQNNHTLDWKRKITWASGALFTVPRQKIFHSLLLYFTFIWLYWPQNNFLIAPIGSVGANWIFSSTMWVQLAPVKILVAPDRFTWRLM